MHMISIYCEMNIKRPYGSMTAEQFQLGDIVEWSVWNTERDEFMSHYGIITEIKNKIVSNRMISNCVVVPLDNAVREVELFTLSLKLVSKAGEQANEVVS